MPRPRLRLWRRCWGEKTFSTTNFREIENQLSRCNGFFRMSALQRQSDSYHHCCFSVCTFSLMKKYQKNSSESAEGDQENSIGLREDYSSSANFLPPRAGKVSAINKGRICNRSELGSGLIVVMSGAFLPETGLNGFPTRPG